MLETARILGARSDAPRISEFSRPVPDLVSFRLQISHPMTAHLTFKMAATKQKTLKIVLYFDGRTPCAWEKRPLPLLAQFFLSSIETSNIPYSSDDVPQQSVVFSDWFLEDTDAPIAVGLRHWYNARMISRAVKESNAQNKTSRKNGEWSAGLNYLVFI